MSSYLELIGRIGGLEPPLFIFGGFAEDILFNGSPIRPHSDTDVVIFRDEVESRMTQFAELRHTEFESWYEPRPGLPLVLHANMNGLDLEPSIFEREGDLACAVIDDPSGQLYRIVLPRGTFSHPPVEVDCGFCRVLSPLANYQIRAAIAHLGIFGALRAKDREDQNQLLSRFLADVDPEQLQLRIESL